MFLDIAKTKGSNGRIYQRALLRNSFRDEQGKVKHQTIANLSQCTNEQLDAIRIALNSPQLIKQAQTLLLDQTTPPPQSTCSTQVSSSAPSTNGPNGPSRPNQSLKQGASAEAILTLAALANELGIT